MLINAESPRIVRREFHVPSLINTYNIPAISCPKESSGVSKNIYGIFKRKISRYIGTYIILVPNFVSCLFDFYSIFRPIGVLFISVVATIVADSNTLQILH